MPTIDSRPDVVTGDVVIGPWRHYEFAMRGELTHSPSPSVAADVAVWLVSGALKWRVCDAKAAYTISNVVFAEPFTHDERYAQLWHDTVAARLIALHPRLWCQTVTAQLFGHYITAAYNQEALSC